MAQASSTKNSAILFTKRAGCEYQEIVRATVGFHGGRETESTEAGLLIKFESMIEALHCAIAIQTALFERNLSIDESRKLRVRIGLHFGDATELAARIESFAEAGGICISQEVVDHVAGKLDLPIFRLGRIRLRDVAKPVTIYRIVLPWDARSGLSSLLPGFLRATPQGWLAGIQVAGILLLLGFVLMKLMDPMSYKAIFHRIDRGPVRSIASATRPVGAAATERELVLPDSWRYSRAADEQPAGSYLLKLSFIGAGGFRHPAMVLGVIPDVSRVYLNGKFIGGSESSSELVMYSFDSALIKPGDVNTILIKAWTRPTLSPGIQVLKSVQPRIGEFEDIAADVSSYRISSRVLRSIELALALLIGVAALCSYLLGRSQRKYLYYSGFLLLGALVLAHCNPFVASALDYPLDRYIVLVGLGLSSAFLFSSYLELRGLRRLETINNVAGIVFCVAAAVLFLHAGAPASRYRAIYDAMSGVAVAYGLVWLGLLALRAVVKVSRPVELRSITGAQAFEAGLIFIFGAIVAYLCHFAAQSALTVAYPFAFALMVLVMALFEYRGKRRSFAYKRKKDDLILSISNLVSRCPDVIQAVTRIQEKLARLLNASRSTIYLATGEDGEVFLKASFIHGPVGIKERIEKAVQPRSGIIGHCMETRSAIFVEDIAKDPRFRSLKAHPGRKSEAYRTGSFMVFPLILGSTLLGVITIADRLDHRPFSREDFCLMHLISKDLAFVLSHSRLEEKAHAGAA